MKPPSKRKAPAATGLTLAGFDLETYLARPAQPVACCAMRGAQKIFAQGEPPQVVNTSRRAPSRSSVLSRMGKEAVVAILGPGDFFGEGVLTGQSIRIGTATAMTPHERAVDRQGRHEPSAPR